MDNLLIALAAAVLVYIAISRLFGDLLNPGGKPRPRHPPANNEPRPPGQLVFPPSEEEEANTRRKRLHRSRRVGRKRRTPPDGRSAT